MKHLNKRLARALFVIALLFFIPGEDSNGVGSELWGKIFDVGHVVIFAGLTGLFLYEFKARSRSIQSCGVGAVVVLVPLVEIIQSYCGRDASWVDVKNGLIGVALGLIGSRLERKNARMETWGAFAGVFVAVCVYALVPAMKEYRAIQYQAAMFPTLADFENPNETFLWDVIENHDEPSATQKVTSNFAATGEHSLHVETKPNVWSGVGYEAGMHSWSDYQELVFTIKNPGAVFSLTVRIDDDGDVTDYQSRYNGSFLINEGVTQVGIPLTDIKGQVSGRTFNLNAIRRVLFFVSREDTQSREFYIDDVRLVP